VKGVAELLRAFERLDRAALRELGHEEGPALLYLGDGPDMGRLVEIREALGCRADILLPGYVPNAAEVVGAADVAVVPSLWAEAFGLSALEPLAWGVPVVASAVGGIPEVVRDGEDGFLVPPGDEVALAGALHRLLKDPKLRARMGASGASRAAQVFSREEQLDALEAIFEREMGL